MLALSLHIRRTFFLANLESNQTYEFHMMCVDRDGRYYATKPIVFTTGTELFLREDGYINGQVSRSPFLSFSISTCSICQEAKMINPILLFPASEDAPSSQDFSRNFTVVGNPLLDAVKYPAESRDGRKGDRGRLHSDLRNNFSCSVLTFKK